MPAVIYCSGRSSFSKILLAKIRVFDGWRLYNGQKRRCDGDRSRTCRYL
ncbi:hypothetical protein QUB68_12130 [Microcoleus sp. A006_D1]